MIHKLFAILSVIIKKLFGVWIVSIHDGGSISYSQEGEDVLLKSLFLNQKKGFYVDIGAYHPTIYSNTFGFYRSGWSGINIDPKDNFKAIFDRHRPKDVNIESAIGLKDEIKTYYIFSEQAVNTFNKSNVKSNIKQGYLLVEKKKIHFTTLKKILRRCNHKIDLMSIDVEGGELNVLKSNDWSKHRPKVIMVEILKNGIAVPSARGSDYWLSVEELSNNNIHKYLCNKGYKFIAKTTATSIYLDNHA